MIPLNFIATFVLQYFELLGMLNAFGNNTHTQAVPHADHRIGNRLVIRVRNDIAHKRLINFQFVDRETLEIRQT